MLSKSKPSSLAKQTLIQDVEASGDDSTFGETITSTTKEPASGSHHPTPRTPRTSRKFVRIPVTPRRRHITSLRRDHPSGRPPTLRFPHQGWIPPSEPVPIKRFTKPLPTPPRSNSPGTPCTPPLSFLTLPPEIKGMIYRELLVSSEPIKRPHKLVCNRRNIMLDSIEPIKDIDSKILRACRTVYFEALPILYGQNTFEFAKPRKLRDFSHGELNRNPPRMSETLQGPSFHRYKC